MASSNPSTGIALEHLPNLTPSQDSINGKIIISALAILFIMVLFMVTLHIYAKWFWRRADRRHMASWRLSHAVYFTQEPPPRTRGLDKDVVESLPIFIYKSSANSVPGSVNCSASASLTSKPTSVPASPSTDSLSVSSQNESGPGSDLGSTECGSVSAAECSVCLCEFQNGEKCRLLPKCSHSFHSHCIDMWFMSNTTCPLCRTSADPSVSEDDREGEDIAAIMCLLPPATAPVQHHRGFNGDENEVGTHDVASLRRQFSTTWRRSISEQFSNMDALEFPTNVLFWGNHGQVNSRLSATEQWHVGGRSFPHVVVDIQSDSEDARLIPSSTSGAPFCSSFDLQSGSSSSSSLQHTTSSRLSSLKRILGRDKRLSSLPQQAGGSGTP